jgi:hypothetical protein
MTSPPSFDREEVYFEYNNEDFLYTFQRSESGRITFKRMLTAPTWQETFVEVYPGGEKAIRTSATIVLFAAHAMGTPMNGILPDVLRKLLGLYESLEQLETDMEHGIAVFPQKGIGNVGDIMEFVAPYTPWAVFPSSQCAYSRIEE